jgi:hypothetical protein
MLLLLDRRLLLRKETKQSGDPYDSYMWLKVVILSQDCGFLVGHILAEGDGDV